MINLFLGFVDNLFHFCFQIVNKLLLISQRKQKLWVSCKLSRNPPTVLCFQRFAIIHTCTYLYSSKCFPQMIQTSIRSANFLSRKSISRITTHSLLKAHSRRIYFNTYLNEFSGLWMRRKCEIVSLSFLIDSCLSPFAENLLGFRSISANVIGMKDFCIENYFPRIQINNNLLFCSEYLYQALNAINQTSNCPAKCYVHQNVLL